MSEQSFGQRVAEVVRRAREVGVQTVYGALVMGAVLQASQGQGAGLDVVAGIGGGLIAAQLERWRQAADPAAAITADAAADPALRAQVDEVLERLGAIEAATQALAEEERTWFVDALRRELAAMGNLDRHRAALVSVRRAIDRVEGRTVGARISASSDKSAVIIEHIGTVAPGGEAIGVVIE